MGNVSFLIVCLFLCGVYCDIAEDEIISAMEGDNLTLHSNVAEEQIEGVIDWRFGPKGDLIARVNRQASTRALYDDIDDGKFRGTLQINDKIGDLTITNIRTTHSGHYVLSIPTKNFKKTFNVTVVLDKTYGVKTIPVMQGESVTLHTEFDKGRTYLVKWIFEKGNIVISKINKVSPTHELITLGPMIKKLELDRETGSLTIRNIRNEQCGIYILQMTSKTHTIHKKFNITMFDDVKSLSVMKGDSVTLHTDAKIFDEVLWMFEHVDSLIAEMNRKNQPVTPYCSTEERFRDRLKLDNQTGSLTIANITTVHAGLYYLEIISRRHTMHKSFIVNVCDALRTITVKVGEPVTLDTGIAKIKQYDQLTWKFGNEDTLIAQYNLANLMPSMTNGKYKDRILYHENGSLTIKNIGMEDYGIYHLEISSTRHTVVKRFNVSVTDSDMSACCKVLILICTAAAVLLVIAVVFVIYFHRRGCKGKGEHENEVL